MKPIACWHHSDLKRLLYHLSNHRIDLYGKDEKTEQGVPRRDYWWNVRMRLKLKDGIRIVVGGRIIAYATINSQPKDLSPTRLKVYGEAMLS